MRRRPCSRERGVALSGAALALLHERTEGWAAGLRLAVLSPAGHPDPERFAAEFSGSERTVAGYLLAEVLERQSEPVRLLLRTSVLDRVNGPLVNVLTRDTGGERTLQDLEDAGAFVMSLDARRSWFRYHRLFADLLQLELRRTAPDEITGLHHAASGWFARHGDPVQAIRHAQAAQDWPLATRLLADHSLGLSLDGQGGTVHELLAGFSAGTVAADAELAAQLAVDQVLRGSHRGRRACPCSRPARPFRTPSLIPNGTVVSLPSVIPCSTAACFSSSPARGSLSRNPGTRFSVTRR